MTLPQSSCYGRNEPFIDPLSNDPTHPADPHAPIADPIEHVFERHVKGIEVGGSSRCGGGFVADFGHGGVVF